MRAVSSATMRVVWITWGRVLGAQGATTEKILLACHSVRDLFPKKEENGNAKSRKKREAASFDQRMIEEVR